ncbi:MAG: hypothetical protein DRG78_22225 [Epsilonproteobacteria bacterium]|nr:MAG: hypothetical protein DRG78_22225 [Campylobacterota bacterium]
MILSSIAKDRKITKSSNLSTLSNIATVDNVINKRVDNFFIDIKDKYRIDEDELYDKLYLKVRKMFLEEE